MTSLTVASTNLKIGALPVIRLTSNFQRMFKLNSKLRLIACKYILTELKN